MAKSAAKANGHPVAGLKAPATKRATKAPAKPAAKAPAAKRAAGPAVKPAAKPAAKAAAKPAAKPAVRKPAAKVATAPKAPPATVETREKVRKTKLVRDSFTMPEQEYAVLGQVKKACLKAGFEIKKSELLRIGVALISEMDLATLRSVLAELPQLKTGRPKGE